MDVREGERAIAPFGFSRLRCSDGAENGYSEQNQDELDEDDEDEEDDE